MASALRIEVHEPAATCDAVVERAHGLGLLGWVRADDDGVVRVHAEGDPAALAELRGFLAGAGRIEERAVKVEGHEQFAVRGVPAGEFTIHEAAGGYVLDLPVGGASRTWALRKAPSMEPSVRRMAIEVDGVDAGAGVWDRGPYEQGGRVPWPEALDRGHAVFVLHGERLQGGFALQRTRGVGAGSQWLLVKRRDAGAR